MSTYEEFMIVLATASLIVSILNLKNKKQPSSSLGKNDSYFLQCIFAGTGDLTHSLDYPVKYIIGYSLAKYNILLKIKRSNVFRIGVRRVEFC